jgi:hypothetical protein
MRLSRAMNWPSPTLVGRLPPTDPRYRMEGAMTHGQAPMRDNEAAPGCAPGARASESSGPERMTREGLLPQRRKDRPDRVVA